MGFERTEECVKISLGRKSKRARKGIFELKRRVKARSELMGRTLMFVQKCCLGFCESR